eukprot:scaffold3658_cov66-Phaeocystis_antarctica.AAC.2
MAADPQSGSKPALPTLPVRFNITVRLARPCASGWDRRAAWRSTRTASRDRGPARSAAVPPSRPCAIVFVPPWSCSTQLWLLSELRASPPRSHLCLQSSCDSRAASWCCDPCRLTGTVLPPYRAPRRKCETSCGVARP